MEKEDFIRQQGSLTELTTKGTEAANHKNGYIGYHQEKIKEEKTNKILNPLSKIVPIFTALVAIYKAVAEGLKEINTQFWIGMVIGICIAFILQYATKITSFLHRRV